MLIRIVKMTFVSGKSGEFMDIIHASKEKIRSFDGCLHLELLNDIQHPNTFFTLSRWRSEIHLENYRNSELFKNVWNRVKVLFAEKPEAWSLLKKEEV